MVAKITYELLGYAEILAKSRREPIQLFASICENTGNNAVYLHSENPNGIPFPFEFYHAVWDVPPPPELDGIIDSTTYEVGKQNFSDEIVYVIRKRDVG